MAIEQANIRRLTLTIRLKKNAEPWSIFEVRGMLHDMDGNYHVQSCTPIGSGLYQLELVQFLGNTEWKPLTPRQRPKLRASELVQQIQSFIGKHGDHEIRIYDDDFGRPIENVSALTHTDGRVEAFFINPA